MSDAWEVEASPGRAGLGRQWKPAGSRGFALVVVVWGLGLVTLVGTMTIVGARYRTRDTGSLAAIAHAAAAAESGIALGLLRAAEPAGPHPVLFGCTLPDLSVVRVMVTREAGKVDLNQASPALLARLFTGLTGDPARGRAVAQAIAAYRDAPEPGAERDLPSAYRAEGRSEGPKHGPFLTPLELDQVVGVSSALVVAALPAVTVLAGRPDPDPEAASPDLAALLDLRQRSAGDPSLVAGAPEGAVTVRAEARTVDGALAVREALAAPGAGPSRLAILEWRRGTLPPDRDWTPDPADARACLR